MPAFKNEHSNPYNYLLYRSVEDANVEVKEFSFSNAIKLDYDLIHIHWPEFFLNSNYVLKALVYSSFMLLCLVWAKLFGKKIVWTVHNLKPHSVIYPKISKMYWAIFLRLVDGVVSLSKANELELIKKFPATANLQKVVTYHGLYHEYYVNNVKPSEARAVLNIPNGKKVFLVLGQVKPYKNVEELIDIFKQKSYENCILLIAGKAYNQQYYKTIVDRIDGRSNILFHEGFVQDANLQAYFSVADYSVIPFNAIFNSGSALLSVSFKTPVLLPYSKNFEEYNALIGNQFTMFSNNLSEAMEKLAFTKLVETHAQDTEVSRKISWMHIGQKTAEFYETLVLGKQ